MKRMTVVKCEAEPRVKCVPRQGPGNEGRATDMECLPLSRSRRLRCHLGGRQAFGTSYGRYFAAEMNGAIAKHEHRAAGMQRLKPHRGVPGVLRRLAAAAAAAGISWDAVFAGAGGHVDRSGGGEPKTLGQCPAVGVLKSRAPAADFAHRDDIGGPSLTSAKRAAQVLRPNAPLIRSWYGQSERVLPGPAPLQVSPL